MVWLTSSETLFAPTVSSIAATSRGAGPIWRRTKLVAASSIGLNGAFMSVSSLILVMPREGGYPVLTDIEIESDERGVTGSPGRAGRRQRSVPRLGHHAVCAL